MQEQNAVHHKLEETLLRFEEDFMFEDAIGICASTRMGIWDHTPGPKPGPEMPKKKRPQIL